MCNICCFYWLRELYEADFHKPGSMEAGEYRTPSGSGRSRRVAVDFVVCFGCSDILIVLFFHFSFFERRAASMRPRWLIYLSTSTGVRTGLHYLYYLSVCICNIRGFYWLRELHEQISTNPGSMEAGDYGLTLGTSFVARRLKVVTVAGLLWISWCVSGAAGFRFFFLAFFLRTHTACCKYDAALPLIYLSTSTGVRTGLWIRFNKKSKNVSCEYDRLNGWNSTLQAAWYIRHVRRTSIFNLKFQRVPYKLGGVQKARSVCSFAA